MGNVTRTGLHHLQGEDEALLSEEGACFNSGSSWSTPWYCLWWREGWGWTETTKAGRAEQAAHLWIGLRMMSGQCNKTQRMNPTKARTQGSRMHGTKFKLYTIGSPHTKATDTLANMLYSRAQSFPRVYEEPEESKLWKLTPWLWK